MEWFSASKKRTPLRTFWTQTAPPEKSQFIRLKRKLKENSNKSLWYCEIWTVLKTMALWSISWMSRMRNKPGIQLTLLHTVSRRWIRNVYRTRNAAILIFGIGALANLCFGEVASKKERNRVGCISLQDGVTRLHLKFTSKTWYC